MSCLAKGPSLLGIVSKAKADMSRHRRAISLRHHIAPEAKP